MRDRELLRVTVVTDDDTGIYRVGELDFGVPFSTGEWLESGDNRQALAKYLRWLGDQCEKSEAPFFPHKSVVDMVREKQGREQ